jgi:hypothetical protein
MTGLVAEVQSPPEGCPPRFETFSGGMTSSREVKQDIRQLDDQAALDAFKRLEPVTFAYKTSPDQTRVGFIAEDVPALVATPDRKGLSSMDIVAVLTEVVRQQQQTIEELRSRMQSLERKEQ